MLHRGICSCLGKTQINGLKRWDAATNELSSLLPFLLRVDSRARYWTTIVVYALIPVTAFLLVQMHF